MKPEERSPEINNFLNAIIGSDREERISHDVCVSCGNMATEFRDECSRREFGISGFCQKCQDDVFGNGNGLNCETMD